MDPLIIFGATYLISVSALAALWVMWDLPHPDRMRFLILVLISLPLAYILAKTSSLLFYNDRPFVVGNFVPLVPHSADNGFPSDHTLLAASIAAVVILFRRNIGIILWVIVFIIGASRVFAGVHHVIDIAGAIAIAAIAVYATHYILQSRYSRES